MLRPFGAGLSSDAIAHRYGFDGNEPDGINSTASRNQSLGVRSTFSIATWYGEISGGFYVNRALFLLIDQAWRSLGLVPVVLDIHQATGLVPVEGEGHLIENEEYALVASDQSRRGLLQTWRFHAGGGGPFYSDNVIFDLVLPEDITAQLVDEVERRCKAAPVRFSREPAAQPIDRNTLKDFVRRLLFR